MRTNVDIDDELLAQAMRQSGAKTKKVATFCIAGGHRDGDFDPFEQYFGLHVVDPSRQ